MKQNSTRNRRSGLTMVEVLIAIVLVSVAAAVVYTELIASYRILMRSRAKLDAQGMAFDTLWESYNQPLGSLIALPGVMASVTIESVPTNSVLFPHGLIRTTILPEDVLTLPEPVDRWNIVVQVYAGTNSPIDFGDRPLVRYDVWRYRWERSPGE